MKNLLLSLFSVLLYSCGTAQPEAKYSPVSSHQYVFVNMPADFPKPFIPSDNPLTIEKVELGRYLFYDKKLSLDSTVSCATCHIQSKAFTDGKKTAIGVNSSVHSKNSMSLTNVVYNTSLTWANPNLETFEVQMLIPIFGENPVEMGMTGKENEILSRLKNDKTYISMFNNSFPNEKESITLANITKAIASFERTLISYNSAYDSYIYNKDDSVISASAKRGEKLFYSEKLECFHCHGGFNFSGETKKENTTFVIKEFHNNGLYNINNNNEYPYKGKGLYDLTNNVSDIGKFRAPTLRNIALTAPYMHDGSIDTLEEVIDHYAQGGRFIESGDFKGDGSKNIYKSGFIKGFKITEQEKNDVIEFLKSLNDYTFINDKKFSDPFQ